MFNKNIALEIYPGENTHLVVMEVAVTHREASPFLSNTCPISVRDLCSGELNVFYCGIIALDNPYSLAFRIGTVRFKMRSPPYPAYREVMGSPNGCVPGIDNWV